MPRLSAEARRERIFAGAMEAFAEHGYEGASMGAIADAAGITPAVIYDHFPSKAALQVELLERQTTELIAFVAAALEKAPEGPEASFRAGCDAYFRFAEEHPLAWRNLFHDSPSDPDVAAAYDRINAQATAAIAGFVKAEGAEQLRAFRDPEQAAETFAEMLKMCQKALASWWYEHQEVPREEILERLMEFCWTGLGAIVAEGSAGA
jgi:AcrR family transcriptional regulator